MACRGRYAPLVRRGHRRHGGRLTTVRSASRLSGSSGASARGAGSQGSVSSGIRSPPVRVLAPASRTREPSELPPASRSTASDAALTPCPAIFRGAEHESLCSQYAGEPATGAASVCCSWRCGSWCARPYNPHVFQSGAVRHPFPLGGRVDQAATTASRCVDVVMEQSKSRADPERETAPSWVLRLEKPSP